MTITLNKQVEETVEIELPAYYKKENHYYALLEEDKSLSVFLFNTGTLVSQGTPSTREIAEYQQCERITEQHFQEALETALERLSKFQNATV